MVQSMEENPKPPGPSLHRTPSRLKQVYHRFFRTKSAAPALAHSIKAGQPAPAPAPLAGSSTASKAEPADKVTGAPGARSRPEKKVKAKWGPGSVFRPVKLLVKAYVKFMMAPIPDEGALPGVGGGAEGYMSVTNSTPRHSLAERDRMYLEALRKEREKSGQLSNSQRGAPLPHQRYYRPTQSGPLPSSSRPHRSSRRYPLSGPLPGSRKSELSRKDSRRYSGELGSEGDLQRRTPQELAKDAIVGNPVVFGLAEPPHPVDQGVASIAELDETPSIVEDSNGSGLVEQHTYVGKPPWRLSMVAEEAGTPRGISLR